MVFAILRALSRAVRRDLSTFRSLQVNNFFLFVALLMYGALESGLPPRSAYPFLLLLGFLLLFPLSSDPLAKIPPQRLRSWPLGNRQQFGLRLAGVALSPVFWIACVLLLATAPIVRAGLRRTRRGHSGRSGVGAPAWLEPPPPGPRPADPDPQ